MNTNKRKKFLYFYKNKIKINLTKNRNGKYPHFFKKQNLFSFIYYLQFFYFSSKFKDNTIILFPTFF